MARRLEQEAGIHLRFALGEVPEEAREEVAAEQVAHGAFLHIPLKVRSRVQHSMAGNAAVGPHLPTNLRGAFEKSVKQDLVDLSSWNKAIHNCTAEAAGLCNGVCQDVQSAHCGHHS